MDKVELNTFMIFGLKAFYTSEQKSFSKFEFLDMVKLYENAIRDIDDNRYLTGVFGQILKKDKLDIDLDLLALHSGVPVREIIKTSQYLDFVQAVNYDDFNAQFAAKEKLCTRLGNVAVEHNFMNSLRFDINFGMSQTGIDFSEITIAFIDCLHNDLKKGNMISRYPHENVLNLPSIKDYQEALKKTDLVAILKGHRRIVLEMGDVSKNLYGEKGAQAKLNGLYENKYKRLVATDDVVERWLLLRDKIKK